MAERRCSRCKAEGPGASFYVNPKTGAWHPWCQTCRRETKRSPEYKLQAQVHEYGITKARYRAMFEEQGGRCAICGREPTPGKVLCIDHDHQTGEVRALLCGNCNSGIGRFADSPEILERAVEYLRVQDLP